MSYFKVLGLRAAQALTDEEVKAAYFNLAKQYHPDTVKQAGGGANRAATLERFRAISEAYENLKTKDQRAIYYRENFGEEKEWQSRQARGRNASYSAGNEEAERAWRDNMRKTNRHTYRLMNLFESFIHPRILFFVLHMCLVGYYTLKGVVVGVAGSITNSSGGSSSSGSGSGSGNKIAVDDNVSNERGELVPAWFNPKTNRHETPAPWSSQYKEYVKRGGKTIMVEKQKVVESERR